MLELLMKPWPWYVSGPLIGLMVPALLLIGNKSFGISSSLRHICAACIPGKIPFFDYNWKSESWNLVFVLGVLFGGFIAGILFQNTNSIQISPETAADMNALGINNLHGMFPVEVFSWTSLFSLRGFVFMVLGGFLVGFGTRYAGGCTSGHAIMGMSNLQLPSLIATCCFFIGGLIMTWFILPLIMHL